MRRIDLFKDIPVEADAVEELMNRVRKEEWRSEPRHEADLLACCPERSWNCPSNALWAWRRKRG